MNIQNITQRIRFLPADHQTDRPILAAISGANQTLLVDAGNSPAHAQLFLQKLARDESFPEPSYLVLTHWHWDHIFGTKAMGLPTFAHQETRHEMAKMLDWDWSDAALDQRVAAGIEIPFCADMIKKEFPGELRQEIALQLPQITFSTKMEIELGGLTCRFEHVGGDHAHDSIVVYVVEEKTLFLGDCLAPAIYAPERFYVPEHFLTLLDRVEAFGAEIFVESHMPGPQTKAEFTHELTELRRVAEAVLRQNGDEAAVLASLPKLLQRDLRDDDQPTIQEFLRGWRLSRNSRS